MKRDEIQLGMLVESRQGAPLRVVSADNWLKGIGWKDRPTGVTYGGHPVVAPVSKETEARRGTGVLVVDDRVLKSAPEGQTVSGWLMAPRVLFRAGTYEGRHYAAKVKQEVLLHKQAAHDAALLAEAADLWGADRAEVLLKGARVRPEADTPLADRDRDIVRTLIQAGRWATG